LLKINIHDTCGVNNLHGLPGILSAIVGIVATAKYGNGAQHGPTQGFDGVGADRQAIALGITMAIALSAGFLAGFLMTQLARISGIEIPQTDFYHDRLFFDAVSDDDVLPGTVTPALGSKADVLDLEFQVEVPPHDAKGEDAAKDDTSV